MKSLSKNKHLLIGLSIGIALILAILMVVKFVHAAERKHCRASLICERSREGFLIIFCETFGYCEDVFCGIDGGSRECVLCQCIINNEPVASYSRCCPYTKT
ncbi:hypothetical protein NLD30_04515 [SCandidatus Aminicenantes bacterium Aminicenantia_JdfR_composite]|nr:hypothetical protein [SCandidatus Aminicenantes bacterium Aminicenantia_JdfR_composite]MCP2596317.1 hypothetical protein [Candidatus Aminicenantes bacterium AC-335-G13]